MKTFNDILRKQILRSLAERETCSFDVITQIIIFQIRKSLATVSAVGRAITPMTKSTSGFLYF